MRELGDILERLVVQLRDHPMRYVLVLLFAVFVLGYAFNGLGTLVKAIRGSEKEAIIVDVSSGDAVGQGGDEKPSFSCADAVRWRELFVCSEKGKQVALDLQLSAAYHQLAKTLDPAGDQRLMTDQNAWLDRTERCRAAAKPDECLIAMTRDRIAALEAQARRMAK
jgi:uncharacterized protein YecT (DUF1311 family)